MIGQVSRNLKKERTYKMNDVVTFDQVTFRYENEDTLLDALSFTVKAGEFVSIVGASGTGKSTIFRLIVGLEEPIAGTIYLNGQKEDNRLGKVGYMPQQDLLVPWRTIIDQISLPLEAEGKRLNRQQLLTQLQAVGLGEVADAYPKSLSGGMRQRVSFLRASQRESSLLLLDEPFSALDAMTKLHMQKWLLKQWQLTQSAVLFITHDISEAIYLSDKIFVIHDKPIQQVEVIDVPLSRPRNHQQLDSKLAIQLKNQLLQSIKVQGFE